MTSVERVMTYTKLDSEPGYKVQRLSPEHWPHKGNITFQDVSLTYYPGGPQVLKKINLSIKDRCCRPNRRRQVIFCGSSNAHAWCWGRHTGRWYSNQTDQLNLQEARRCISVLGQSPVLFSGSLRKNLDILDQLQDADLLRALGGPTESETRRSKFAFAPRRY